MQLGWEPERWLQLSPRRLLLLVLLLMLASSHWVMEIGVGTRWKRPPNHRRPQAMTMHPCPAVEAGGAQGLVSVTSRDLAGACERRLAGCNAATQVLIDRPDALVEEARKAPSAATWAPSSGG